jgi:hypothetical protein
MALRFNGQNVIADPISTQTPTELTSVNIAFLKSIGFKVKKNK